MFCVAITPSVPVVVNLFDCIDQLVPLTRRFPDPNKVASPAESILKYPLCVNKSVLPVPFDFMKKSAFVEEPLLLVALLMLILILIHHKFVLNYKMFMLQPSMRTRCGCIVFYVSCVSSIITTY